MAIMYLYITLLAAEAISIKDSSCSQSDLFTELSFQLAFYPPGDSDYSQPILFGTFNQQTYVSSVTGSWSADNTNWNDFSSSINNTYPSTMLVMFAPWIHFTSLPDSQSGDYAGRIEIFGSINPDSPSEQLWCTYFEIPYIEN